MSASSQYRQQPSSTQEINQVQFYRKTVLINIPNLLLKCKVELINEYKIPTEFY